MHNILDDRYQSLLEQKGFHRIKTPEEYNSTGICWQLSSDIGFGFYWIYAQKDLFDIKIHDFYFHEDSFLEFNLPETLSITSYESISGEELSPYRRLSAGCIKTFVGGYEPYKVLVHKKIPIRSIGIEIMPAYYNDYLKKQYPGKYTHPLSAFRQIDQTTDFPEMSMLLHQVKSYRRDGISASLFYEGKVAEAVSLVVDAQEKYKHREQHLSTQDISSIENATAYLNDHYAFEIPLDRLAQIACMGTTKFKLTFKQFHGCSVTEYIQQRRMSQAEHLLAKTDLTIGQIAQTVGYSTSSRFAELFRKNTGILPREYRKIAQ